MTVRELIKALKRDGWYQIRMDGSHRHFRHPDRDRIITVAGNLGKTVPKGTLSAILKQAGLKGGHSGD